MAKKKAPKKDGNKDADKAAAEQAAADKAAALQPAAAQGDAAAADQAAADKAAAEQAAADQADEAEGDQDADADQPPADPPADPPTKGKSRLVRVEVRRSIAFGGVVVRPKIDNSGRGKGQPQIVTPVKAVIPRAVAECYAAEDLVILGNAANGAKVGVIE